MTHRLGRQAMALHGFPQTPHNAPSGLKHSWMGVTNLLFGDICAYGSPARLRWAISAPVSEAWLLYDLFMNFI